MSNRRTQRKTPEYVDRKGNNDGAHGKDTRTHKSLSTPRATENWDTSGSGFNTTQKVEPMSESKMSTRTSSGATTPGATYSAAKLGGTRTSGSDHPAKAEMQKRTEKSSSTVSKVWQFLGYSPDNNDNETRPQDYTKPEDLCRELKKQLDRTKAEKVDREKIHTAALSTREKECKALNDQLIAVQQAVKQKDDYIYWRDRQYSKLENLYIELQRQLGESKLDSQAKDDIIKRNAKEHSNLEKQYKQLLYQARQAVQEKDTNNRNMQEYSKLEKQYKEMKYQLEEAKHELQEKNDIIRRFGIDASKRFKATGQATNINDDDPCDNVKESLDDLWDNYYRPACEVMESTAKQKMHIIQQEICSIKNAEDYLDIIMTDALQKAFNFSVDYIKNHLKRALEEEMHCQSAKSHRFISMLPKKQLLMEGIKLIDLHYKDTLDSSDKQKKSETLYKEFMVFVYDTIQFTDPASLQEGAETIFLKTVNENMRILSMEFTTSKYPLFSQAATTTSKAIWQMIKLPSPILLKSHGIKVIQQMQLPFDEKEMRVHAASTKKSTRVAGFAEPIVISSKTGGVISQGSVFCK